MLFQLVTRYNTAWVGLISLSRGVMAGSLWPVRRRPGVRILRSGEVPACASSSGTRSGVSSGFVRWKNAHRTGISGSHDHGQLE